MKDMDPVPVLMKISQLIQLLIRLSDKARYYKRNCQTFSDCIQLLEPLSREVQKTDTHLIGLANTPFERIVNTLLKAKELLERCEGLGSRCHVVFQKQQVLKEFEEISLEMQSVLSSLPVKSLQLSQHSQIQVEQCVEHLQRAKYSIGILEEKLIEEVAGALKDIREGVKISHERLTQLAARFDLKSNQEILKEALSLEKERNNAQICKDKEEEELISTLIVLVTQMGDDLAEKKQAQAVMGGIPVPPDFLCPLSLELMSDPVIVASGQTYERSYIQQWLDQGNITCPKTGLILSHTNLISNYTVKALISNWCETNNVSLPEPAKFETGVVQQLSSRKIDVNCRENSEQGPAPAISYDGQAVAAISSRPRVRSVRTIRTRALEHLDVGRDTRSPVRSLDGTSGYLQASSRSIAVGNADGQDQSILLGVGDCFSNGTYGHSENISALSPTTNIEDSNQASQLLNDMSPYSSVLSGEFERLNIPSISSLAGSEEHGSPASVADSVSVSWGREVGDGDLDMPSVPSPLSDVAGDDEGNIQARVQMLIEDLQSFSFDKQRKAAAELRQLAKYNMENRIIIANFGAIRPLLSLLESTDPQIQENAVTALLNLSINDNNKTEIAAAGAIAPLVNVLNVGTSEAKENAAATLFSLSVMDENKVAIGQSGAIPPLVDLLMNGTSRGKKDAATALFNLSILHENKARIVRANAIRPLIKLMSDPASGMVDKAVAVLANLATIPEGRYSIGEEEGIPALVEVVELGSQRGKENATAALVHLCQNNTRFRAQVLQEGAIPPLVALTKSGTARAKEKASSLLRLFRDQRHAALGRAGLDRHADG